MIQLDNLASHILKQTDVAINDPSAFGNVWQEMVRICLSVNRPGLARQGGAGNPDFIWQAQGWEVKSGSQTCQISQDCVVAMTALKNPRLVHLDKTSPPYIIRCSDISGFLAQNHAWADGGGQATVSCTPGRLSADQISEEMELKKNLEALLRSANSSLYEGLPQQQISMALAGRLQNAARLLGW